MTATRMLGLSLLALAGAAPDAAAQRAPRRPVNTYSIVAVDSATGQIGTAVERRDHDAALRREL